MDNKAFIVTNPATGEDVASYGALSPEGLKVKVQKSADCFSQWSKVPIKERCKLLNNAARVLDENKLAYAEIITQEMGKTKREAISEVEKCTWVCRYYADNAIRFLKDEKIESDASLSLVSFQPLGVILAVMPWNFPFWQVFRFAAPALAAGNVGLLKHASNVPGCALAIESVFEAAGFPVGAFTSLLIRSDRVKGIIDHEVVRACTLTGSEAAGSAVAEHAGRKIKKTVLELGGSDAYVILEDADIKLAVEECVKSRLLNAGQSCIGAKRFIIVEKVYEEFSKLFIQEMASAKMGNPNASDTDYGPMAREDLRKELHAQVLKSIEQGARLSIGGELPKGPGAFYPATVLENVKPGMPAFDEELFGPVAALIKAKDEPEAISLANQSKFGLGAAVFTEDIGNGLRIAREELEAGACFVNGLVKSDPRLPFGGIKTSGYGRELSRFGIQEFVNIKTVWIR